MNTGFSSSTFDALIRAGRWFKSLPPELQHELLGLGRLRRLSAGQCLFARGAAPDGVYGVVKGAIRICTISEAGKEAVLAVLQEPHWFGEIALFDGLPRTHDAWAERDTWLLHLPLQGLASLLEREPAYWRQFGLLLTQKLRTTFEGLAEVALLPAAGQLTRRLVMMAEGYGEWKDRGQRVILAPQEQLALTLSLSRQTVNQILKQLETDGAIRLIRGGIEIIDMERLRALAV